MDRKHNREKQVPSLQAVDSLSLTNGRVDREPVVDQKTIEECLRLTWLGWTSARASSGRAGVFPKDETDEGMNQQIEAIKLKSPV